VSAVGRRSRAALRRVVSAGALLLVAVLAPLFVLPSAEAGASGGAARVRIVVNGQPVATSSDAHPVRLQPRTPARVKVTVTAGASELRISTVKFQGDVMALPLFSYDSAVSLVVPPHETKSVTFIVTLAGIGNEATGLVDANFSLLSAGGATVASQSGVTDVNGSIGSLYGLFGLAVLLLTVTSLAFGLIALARHQLSQNRWVRAVRFFIPGFGVGLVLIFTLSAFRLFDPGNSHWLPLLVICSAVGLFGGFLTPAPDEEEFDDYDPDVLIAQIMIVDDDPLDVFAGQPVPEEADRELVLSSVVRPTSVPAPAPWVPDAPDGRATTAPPAPSVPDGRATTAPPAPSVPDSRATMAPPPEPPEGEPHPAG
jgi:hypothetical protein